jgi:hypothetical protein
MLLPSSRKTSDRRLSLGRANTSGLLPFFAVDRSKDAGVTMTTIVAMVATDAGKSR